MVRYTVVVGVRAGTKFPLIQRKRQTPRNADSLAPHGPPLNCTCTSHGHPHTIIISAARIYSCRATVGCIIIHNEVQPHSPSSNSRQAENIDNRTHTVLMDQSQRAGPFKLCRSVRYNALEMHLTSSGRLAGKTIAIKENISYAPAPTSCSSDILEGMLHH